MRWLDFGARNRQSDKGCHPFYEFPYDTAKICSFFLFAKLRQNSCQSILLLFPPVLVVVEDVVLALRTAAFLVERILVADSELDELSDMEMALHGSLEIHVIPDAAFRSKSEIMRSLFTACSMRSLICQRTLRDDNTMVVLMIIIVEVAGRILEIYNPIKNSRHPSEFEFIVQG